MRKWMCTLLAVTLLSGLTACGKDETPVNYQGNAGESSEENEEESADIQTVEHRNYKENVIDASEFIIYSEVAFWGYNHELCSALLDDENDLYDFISEGSMDTNIYSIALDGNSMYMATDSGIVCVPLGETDQEQTQASVIDDHKLSTSSFQIYNEYIYFTYGASLYSVPKEGGENKTLESNIESFQVTTEGIYCINGNGDLVRISLDGTERKTLSELGSEGEIVILNDKAYITTGDDRDYIYVYDLEEDSVEKLHFENDLSPYCPVWVTEDSIYYESEDYDIFRYDIVSGTETQSDAEYTLPDYDSGYLKDNVVYYALSDDLFWMHLDSGKSVNISKEEALKGTSSANTSLNTSTGISETTGTTAETNSDYNIAENIGVYNSEGQARLESKYFTLYLPADGDWTYEVLNDTAVSIFYLPAYESGNGGELVTIEAYDWGDNDYEYLPNYKIAGVSADKIYIADFPTDVQYTPSQEAGYRKMFDYVQRIDNSEENINTNPFSCQ